MKIEVGDYFKFIYPPHADDYNTIWKILLLFKSSCVIKQIKSKEINNFYLIDNLQDRNYWKYLGNVNNNKIIEILYG